MSATGAPETTARVAAALAYAARGWHVFPAHSIRPDGRCTCPTGDCGKNAGKHPRTAHGFEDATTDPATIRRWWMRWPDANVAIATGAVSGLVVLDVDPRNGGQESLDALLEQHGRLPDGPQVLTGGGGVHYYFTHPGHHVPCCVLAPGLDLKADGGYVLAPPSNHRGPE